MITITDSELKVQSSKRMAELFVGPEELQQHVRHHVPLFVSTL